MRNAEWGRRNGRWRMADGRWRMADGGWRMADGGWQMPDGGWRMPRQKGPPTFPGCQKVGGAFPLPIVDGRLNSNFLYFSLPVAAQASQAFDTQPGARHRRRTPTIHRGRAHRTISAGCFDEIQQVGRRDVCNAGQNLVGSRGGRRHAVVDGSLNSGFLYLNETAPRWENHSHPARPRRPCFFLLRVTSRLPKPPLLPARPIYALKQTVCRPPASFKSPYPKGRNGLR